MLVRRIGTVLLCLIFANVGGSQLSAQEQQDVNSTPGIQIAVAEAAVRDVGNYIAAVDQANISAYVAAVDQANLDTYLAAVKAAEVKPASVAQSRTSVTNNGAHSDAWWQGVSVCEQGGRNDSFFGYFSIMDGSAGGLDWSTQVAMANAIIARAGDGAWAASCQAAGYAKSPSG